MTKKKDPRLTRLGLDGYNKPKRTPSHPKKKSRGGCQAGRSNQNHPVWGAGGKTHAGAPKKRVRQNETKAKGFKARHAKNIAKGKMSAAYWADKVKW